MCRLNRTLFIAMWKCCHCFYIILLYKRKQFNLKTKIWWSLWVKNISQQTSDYWFFFATRPSYKSQFSVGNSAVCGGSRIFLILLVPVTQWLPDRAMPPSGSNPRRPRVKLRVLWKHQGRRENQKIEILFVRVLSVIWARSFSKSSSLAISSIFGYCFIEIYNQGQLSTTGHTLLWIYRLQ